MSIKRRRAMFDVKQTETRLKVQREEQAEERDED